jgi:putative inorganic carbon (HCO3(-)) transporter
VIVLTKTRGAWLGIAIAVWAVLLYRWPRLTWLALPGLPGLAWATRHTLSTLEVEGLSGLPGRYELWSRAIYMIQDMPVLGGGAGTFELLSDAQFPFYLRGSTHNHAHNLFLQAAVDLGLPGLVAFLALLILVLWCAMDATRRFRQAEEHALGALSWAGLATMVAMLTHGTLDTAIWIRNEFTYVFWAIIGTVLALYRLSHALDRRDTTGAATS